VATAALQRQTRTIPIVFANLSDPVASGIVERLARTDPMRVLVGDGVSTLGIDLDVAAWIVIDGPTGLLIDALGPTATGGTNFWPSSYSRRTGYLYIPAAEGCGQVSVDTSAHIKGSFGGGAGGGSERITSSFTILDPGSGEIKKRVELPYPNSSGVLSTAGGIVVTALLDGSIIAFDDQTQHGPDAIAMYCLPFTA
jgi:hypothetical protein